MPTLQRVHVLAAAALGLLLAPSPTAAGAAAAACDTPTHPGIAFNQDDVKHVTGVPSYQACCALCLALDGCKAYTWGAGSDKNCYLKSAPNQPRASKGSVSSVIGTTPCAGYKSKAACDTAPDGQPCTWKNGACGNSNPPPPPPPGPPGPPPPCPSITQPGKCQQAGCVWSNGNCSDPLPPAPPVPRRHGISCAPAPSPPCSWSVSNHVSRM